MPSSNYYFGCARLQPIPLSSPASILPSSVTHYTIRSFGNTVRDITTKQQWQSARFHFGDVEEPLDIFSPIMRAGKIDPCPVVCTPYFEANGDIRFLSKNNPYFHADNWEPGLKSLFEVIRLHHHTEGPNGEGRLLRSASFTREGGIKADWYPGLKSLTWAEIRQAIFLYLIRNPQHLDECGDLIRSIEVPNAEGEIILGELSKKLEMPPFENVQSQISWLNNVDRLKDWWALWQKDFLENIMDWPSDEDKTNILVPDECNFEDSFYGQQLVEETIPMLLRGSLWRLGHHSDIRSLAR